MDVLFDNSLTFTRWLQESFPNLEGFMSFVSALGQFEFYLALILLIYWDIDKGHGKRLAYLMALTNVTINGFKHLLQQPRPFWVEADLQIGETEGYGVPSGHVGMATTTFIYIAAWIRQQWAWTAAVFIVLTMALSRVYLGQHFLIDVIAGFSVGIILLLGYLVGWRTYVDKPFKEMILGQRFWITIGVPIAAGVIYGLSLYFIGGPDQSVPWADFLTVTELFSLEEMTSALAILLGLGMGFVLEGSRVRYLVEAELWQKIGRYLLGLVLTLGILYGLSVLFDSIAAGSESLWVILPLRFVRYWVVAIFGSFYAPLFFIKIGLATAAPEPEIDVSIKRFGK